MSGKATAFVAGVLLLSMFWIVLAQQSYCAGSLADWLKMGDVEADWSQPRWEPEHAAGYSG